MAVIFNPARKDHYSRDASDTEPRIPLKVAYAESHGLSTPLLVTERASDDGCQVLQAKSRTSTKLELITASCRRHKYRYSHR